MRLCRLVVSAVLMLSLSGFAAAQEWPTRHITAIVPFGPGNSVDIVGRLLVARMSELLGQQIIVENRPGANGFIAIEAAKKAAPDGYTLVQMDDTHLALQPHLYKKIPYDINKDFDPVATLFRTYFFVVVPASSNWKDMKDLIAAAKTKNGDLTYGSWFVGSPGHVGGAMLEAATGTKMTHVPF